MVEVNTMLITKQRIASKIYDFVFFLKLKRAHKRQKLPFNESQNRIEAEEAAPHSTNHRIVAVHILLVHVQYVRLGIFACVATV